MLEMDQICLWVVGWALHDDQHCLCVPDLSCCVPELLAPREIREAYLAAYLGQYDSNLRRAQQARRRIARMNLRFLHQLVRVRAYVTPADAPGASPCSQRPPDPQTD
jgi:hypothetical protein